MVLMLALYGLMLIIMLMRVGVPIGVRVDGRILGDIPLSFRERVRLQRTNVYLVGGVLLLGALGGWMNVLMELLVIVGVVAILSIPTHYIVTSEGLALNQVVFRRWGEFAEIATERGGLRLCGREGCRDFRIVVGPERQGAAHRLIGTALRGEAGPTARREKTAKQLRGARRR